MTCSTSFGLVQRWMYGKKFDSTPFCFKISLLWITELPLREITQIARKYSPTQRKLLD